MMKRNILTQSEWRVIDQSMPNAAFEAKQSFAIDDTLCMFVGSGQSPAVARTWVHPRTIVLGIQDSKLPYLSEGVKYLDAQNYSYIVRNSGGLAVVLDQGIWNLSLLFSEKEDKLSIDDGFEAMADFIKKMLEPYGMKIAVEEIVGSYCPGSYDLSIGGRKFAGISQRRLRQAVAVQIYVCVDGSGSERARLVKNFYDIAIGGQPTKINYPEIKPEVMASLSELSGQPITMQTLMKNFYQTLGEFGRLSTSSLAPEEALQYEKDYLRMVDRNEKAFPFLYEQ
ncbi:octanoyl-[GcvH]:protein N-octanoyltransferase [Pullulanibacillus pueri]|nr:lipoate--protein ligase family protein [Pullulanibacillus pueri]MBM7681676.1 octanoyl-[GcvH]:protein N-octanoyltransferase [Pullulanibacillus pueri]